jgi:protease secretion system outer membrane protein
MGVHRKIATQFFVFALVIVTPLAGAASLGEAYRAALENDPYFQAAYYAYQAGSEDRNIGRSNLLPEVSLTARSATNRGSRTTSNLLGPVTSPIDYNSSSSGVYLRQPLFSLERYARFRQGGLQADIAEKTFEASRQELLIRISSVYLEAMVAKSAVDFAVVQLRAMSTQLEQAKRMLAHGEATIIDVDIATTQHQLAEIQETEARDRLDEAKHTLTALTKLDIRSLPVFLRSIKTEISSITQEQIFELTAMQNPAILEKMLAVEAAEQNVTRALSGHLPSLDLTANYSKNNQDSLVTVGQRYTTRSVGIEMQWPILNGGQASALTRKASAELSQAKQELEIARIKAKVDANSQYHASKLASAKIQALSTAITAGERNIEAMRVGLRLGVRTIVEVTNAEQQLAQTLYDYNDAIRNHVIAELKLTAAMGTLHEEKLIWVESFTQME